VAEEGIAAIMDACKVCKAHSELALHALPLEGSGGMPPDPQENLKIIML